MQQYIAAVCENLTSSSITAKKRCAILPDEVSPRIGLSVVH
jgi:hypothetical protein